MVKICERQELELLLTEQQENLAILRRHKLEGQNDNVTRRRHQPSNTRDTLTSIDELSSISDCCSSGSSDSVHESKGVFRTMSTPRYPRSDRKNKFKTISTDSMTSEEFGNDRDTSRSSDLDVPMSQCSSSSSLNGEAVASSSLSSSSSSLPESVDRKAATEVDPAIMADIEVSLTPQKHSRVSHLV